MARSGYSYGLKLPDDRRELTEAEMRWLEALRDLYAGRVLAPRMIDVQTLRGVLERDLRSDR